MCPKSLFSLCCPGPEFPCYYSCNITLFWVLPVSDPSSGFPKMLFCNEKNVYKYFLGRMKSILTWRFEMFWIVQSCLLLMLTPLSQSPVLDISCWDMILLYIPCRKAWPLKSFLYPLLTENWASGLLLQSGFEEQERTKNDNIAC